MSKDRDLASLRQELDNAQNLNVSLREQLERTHKDNITLSDDNNFLRKKISSFKQEITNNHNECSRIESELYERGQEVERLKKENVGFLKNKREVERKLREETQSFEKDRVVWQERESELLDQVKALQDTIGVLAQQNEQASQKKNDSPPDTPTLDNSHYLAVREAKNAQRIVKDLERRNNEISAELDKAKQATTESMNLNKSHVRRIQQLENELSQVKHMHQSLMEENESYQLLLHEKTMKGEFVLNPIMQRNDSYSEKKLTDTAEKVTNGGSKDESSSSQDDDNLDLFKNADLAAELNRASVLSTSLLGERVHKESGHTIIELEKLQEEIKSLKDVNKSMSLYIEKILNRIMEAQGGFEEILSSEWKPTTSTPATPTTGSFNLSTAPPSKEESKTKKIERRKTLSWHFRSTSQPQNDFKKDKIISEEPDQIHPLRKSNEDTVTPLSDVQKRPQRRNSTSTRNTKRFSLFGGWGGATKEEEKKDDPYMRPIILVQQERDRKE